MQVTDLLAEKGSFATPRGVPLRRLFRGFFHAAFRHALGWLAGQIVRGTGFGLIADIAIGIVGALIGSWLLPHLGIHLGSGIVPAIIGATIGAIVLLLILRLAYRRGLAGCPSAAGKAGI